MTTYKNRGMFLENIINDSNTYYNSIDKSLIFKKPTPIKVLNVSYPTNKSHLIDKAVYSNISTLDYNGIYREKYIEFDAKECHSKTSFPLSNIKDHQLEHIKKVINAVKDAGKIMVATGDVHHFAKEDKIYREIIINQKVPGGGRHPLAKKRNRKYSITTL